MKLLAIVSKSVKEQWRSFWILLLTLSMGPFFMFVYFLIIETSKPHYDIAVINNDNGFQAQNVIKKNGEEFIAFLNSKTKDLITMPISIRGADDTTSAIEALKNKKIDVLIIIPDNFSEQLDLLRKSGSEVPVDVQFIGDLTSLNYLISAMWANEILSIYAREVAGTASIVNITETGIGMSSNITDFDLAVPGILILSVIMLMFTATVAFVTEVENKTIIRLKLSKLTSFTFISGITIVQVLVGVVSILLTLGTASVIGFEFRGSVMVFFLIAILTSFSMIAFSLIIAALTKTANEVLVVGNFPLFLFMFFTGAAFPFKSEGLFTLFGYPVSFQGLMSPTHAISALNKIMIMQMKFSDIIPEIISLIILIIIYFIVGWTLFRRNHMRLK